MAMIMMCEAYVREKEILLQMDNNNVYGDTKTTLFVKRPDSLDKFKSHFNVPCNHQSPITDHQARDLQQGLRKASVSAKILYHLREKKKKLAWGGGKQ